jgi:peptide/nickel transport system permease protein
MWLRRISALGLRLLLTALLGGLLGATLVRFAPGFDVDERELDPRLSLQTLQAIRAQRAAHSNVFSYYAAYLSGITRGNFGVSLSLNRPVAELFIERLPVTLRTLGLGLLLGWLAGFLLAVPGTLRPAPAYDVLAGSFIGVFLCVPSAVLALLLVYAGGAPAMAIALVIFPRVFRFVRNLLQQTGGLPHVLSARARGLTPARIFARHVLPLAAPSLFALLGVSVSLGLGASIPVEVICDSPGIGQLAWHAAMGRDLPLLIHLTLFITLVTLTANSFAEMAGGTFVRQPA